MANFNKVMLMGNVTRDIELRYTPKGTAVADVGLAVNRVRSGENGERIEETTFVDITLWGRTAEVAHQYSGKGKPLFVEGRLHMDSWDDKTSGQKRTKLKVVADNIQLMGAPGGGSGGGGGGQPPQGGQGGNPAPQQQQQQAQQQPPQEYQQQGGSPAQGGQVDDDGDIPF
ncbi:MAG: single-stranded DNA-binding protein [Akkermansiaceae bacterium]|jgi:single-strand DNA-binding protein|tara:strand:- start:295 stop:807 length:513 start_codon:yes stop_codon:yes gene_type:complete